MKQPKRQNIRRTITQLYGDDFEGSVSGIIEKLQKYKDEYPDAKIDRDWYSDYGGEQRQVFTIYYETPETDDEFSTRLIREKKIADAQEIREREEFIRLRNKFKGLEGA